ncbi:hypothetical protein OB919_13605 [Halobacteria archaeon AArc-curdl1]|uniref:Uncharacterized protein n=1 Tax=Natronosalvus hydrolyticus TaxID=2979988 RepID=A0AAP2ZAG7_9EURY|nr:hypothetical protein [Halobacteria archaeon AArc-curdl1]
MDRAETCRRAAYDAIADVEPAALYEFITTTLENASMAPGALTLASAGALTDRTYVGNGTETHTPSDVTHTDPSASDTERTGSEHASRGSDSHLEGIAHHAAGVQLIYEGLRLTRSLAHEEPWTEFDGDSHADLEILAADILVARGFYLLARTDAADKAVETVRHFGRDQTLRASAPETDRPAYDANLERDVLELAIKTGATAVDATPTPALLSLATDITATIEEGFPPAADCVPALETGAFAGPDGETSSGADLESAATDRVPSASDH